MAKATDILIKRTGGNEISVARRLNTWKCLADQIGGTKRYAAALPPEYLAGLVTDVRVSIASFSLRLNSGNKRVIDAAIAGFKAGLFGMELFRLDEIAMRANDANGKAARRSKTQVAHRKWDERIREMRAVDPKLKRITACKRLAKSARRDWQTIYNAIRKLSRK